MSSPVADGLKWSEAFAVGHPGLDQEHRSIVDAINAIARVDPSPHPPAHLQDLLTELRGTAARHFDHENAILRHILASAETQTYSPHFLRAMSRGALAQHIDNHERDLGALETIGADANRPLHEELEHWFFSHAVKFDAHLKALFQAIHSEYPRLLAELP
ncbi:MAG: hypothetical protein KGJ78_05680 [Alphaproteobacteria bacterium]|nr:hypothetical protein [Alphaproteobacteria bacterium]